VNLWARFPVCRDAAEVLTEALPTASPYQLTAPGGGVVNLEARP
jgi:hypothetical protein